MVPLYKGDKVLVNYTKFGHNVVNAISEVVCATGHPDYYIITRPVGAEPPGIEGNWSLKLQAPEMVQHFPELKIGDEVFILGYPKSVNEGNIIGVERGQKQKVTNVQETGNIRLNTWWYDRRDVTTNPEAMTADAMEKHEHCYFPKAKNAPTPVYKPAPVKPTTKYKVINRPMDRSSTKENDNGFVSL